MIASGGVGKLDHLVEGIREGHATAVLAASIFHFGEFTIPRLRTIWSAPGCRCGSTLKLPVREVRNAADATAIPPSGARDLVDARFTIDDLAATIDARAARAESVLYAQASGQGRRALRQEARRGGGRNGYRRGGRRYRRPDPRKRRSSVSSARRLEARGITRADVDAELGAAHGRCRARGKSVAQARRSRRRLNGRATRATFHPTGSSHGAMGGVARRHADDP